MANMERCIHCGQTLWVRQGAQPYGHSSMCVIHPDNIARRAAELSAAIDTEPKTFDKAFPQFSSERETIANTYPGYDEAKYRDNMQPMCEHPDVMRDADRRAVIRAYLWFALGFCSGTVLLCVLTWFR